MVNPDAIPDGKYRNLYCPDCQAHPDDYEAVLERDGWYTLRDPYCKASLNATVGDEYVPTSRPPSESFDDRLFETDD